MKLTCSSIKSMLLILAIGTTCQSIALDTYRPDNKNFYTVKADVRRCASPMCGGWFIKKVNAKKMRCSDGSLKAQCYVGAMSLQILNLSNTQKYDLNKALYASTALLKGQLNSHDYGALIVSQVWIGIQSYHFNSPTFEEENTFYNVTDNGIRCFTTPCSILDAQWLNQNYSRPLTHIDLSHIGASQEQLDAGYISIPSENGLIVQGNVDNYSFGEVTLIVHNFYLEVIPEIKPCKSTGCSGQICSDQDITTHCEYKPKYACYQNAVCHVNKDRDCSWRMDTQLENCLNTP